MPPKLPSSLGLSVSTRDFSFFEMVARAWGSEFFAPDHRIYQFGGARFFDSTDLGFTGIYSPGLSQATSSVLTTVSDPINPTAVILTWTLSTVYGSEIDFYNIFRSVNGGAFTLLVSLGYEKDFTTYTDSSLNPANTYTYYVIAVANVGTNGQSNSVSIAPASAPVLSGSVIGTTEIDLSWTASTVLGSTIQNYLLYRQVDGGGFSLLTVTAGNVLTFHDLSVGSGHTYNYYVVAKPVSGFSATSNTITETIASAGGGFVAVGGLTSPFIATRNSGGVWNVQAAAAATFGSSLGCVAEGSGVIVIGSSGSEIGTSSNGAVTVTQRTLPPGSFAPLTCATGDTNIALVGGNGQQYLYSTDGGVTWQLTNTAGGGSYSSAALGAGGGKFAGSGLSSGADNKFSADGITWTPSISSNGGRGLIYDGTQFVLAGRGGFVHTSPDGDVYADFSSALDSLAIAYNGSVYVLVEFFGNRLIRSATIAGLAAAMPQTVAAGNFTAIAADSSTGLFIAVDDAGFAYSSSDGVTWTQENTGASGDPLNAVCVSPTQAVGGSFQVRANSISSSCPGNYLALPSLPGPISPFGGTPCGCFNDFAMPFGSITTALTPQVPLVNGHPLLVFALITGAPNRTTICLSGTLPQNAWTSMSVDGIWGETYLSAHATIFDNTTYAPQGFTIWLFDTLLDPFSPFLFFTPFTVTFT